MHENPFDTSSGLDPTQDVDRHRLSLANSVLFVMGSTFGGALLGLAAGGFLGSFFPGYYQGVFNGGNQPDFNPMVVGLGLGFTQGMGLGVFAGVAIVAILAFRDLKLARMALPQQSEARQEPPTTSA